MYNGDEQSAKFSNNPGAGNGEGGTCYGDSGGPIFHGNTNVIGAITSWGITPCIGVDYNFRMDTKLAQDFVKPFLQ
jgi:secreted trypsin-like serine protease